jgi:hypothetical protein
MTLQNLNNESQAGTSVITHQSGSGDSQNPTRKQMHLLRMHQLNKSIGNPVLESWSMPELVSKLKIQSPNKIIDLSPFYQRMDVWPDKKRKEFLNNLFLGCPINDIILVHYKTDERGRKFYRVMDGKQRVTCIMRFTQDSNIKIDLDEASMFPWFNQTFQELCSNLDTTDMFDNVYIQAKIYDTTALTEEDSLDWESWTFTEMNSSMSLNNIEKRNAHNNEMNDILKDIYQNMNMWDRIYTKSISENDRYKNKEIIEKVFYQSINSDWFSNKMTAATMMKFQEDQHSTDVLSRVKENFYFIHNIMNSNENLKKMYWNVKTDRKGRTTYTKTGFCSPLNNLDLLVYGMSLLDTNSKTDVKTKFDNLVSIFYHYMDVYQNNMTQLSTEHLQHLRKFIDASLRGTSSTGLKRKEYLDYLYSVIN